MTFQDAKETGKPIRRPIMQSSDGSVRWWYRFMPDNSVHVIGPDEIVPYEDAMSEEWENADDWIVWEDFAEVDQ